MTSLAIFILMHACAGGQHDLLALDLAAELMNRVDIILHWAPRSERAFRQVDALLALTNKCIQNVTSAPPAAR